MGCRFVDQREITTAAELSEAEQEQLRAAGRLYDGEDLSAEERLGAAEDEEASFAGFVALWRVVDGAEHRYDAWLYQVDSGTIFRAGTTEVAAEIIQFGLEPHSDEARRDLGPALVAAGLLPRSDSAYAEFAALLAEQA
ncbi:hypothetical protein [Dactylosporangium sp. CA-139066]|uniref:hypothetical protein n=1 Tax=Dactylosporangium sp. CA-139066 TaxID=3239930 RepID=UPI003D8DC206